ncbi:MAG: rimI [Caulobacteraceae bacterium]|nr:rimI [Caulobacteraceae bacterium]
MTRAAAAADAEVLAAIHAGAFAAPWRVCDVAALLEQPEVFGLMSDGAFILMRVAAGEAEVLTLAVEPRRRRRGLAGGLLAAAIRQARTRGAESVFLEVAADNAPAIGLYRRAGFEQVGLRRGYYAGAEGAKDALVLRRDLNSPAG